MITKSDIEILKDTFVTRDEFNSAIVTLIEQINASRQSIVQDIYLLLQKQQNDINLSFETVEKHVGSIDRQLRKLNKKVDIITDNARASSPE